MSIDANSREKTEICPYLGEILPVIILVLTSLAKQG
jgi:hypothetical protein